MVFTNNILKIGMHILREYIIEIKSLNCYFRISSGYYSWLNYKEEKQWVQRIKQNF